MGDAVTAHSLLFSMSHVLTGLEGPCGQAPPAEAEAGARAELSSLLFEEVYREHVTFVWRSLRRLGLAEADAEDAVQDVFVVVHARLATFEGRSRLSSWLYGICLRVAQNRRRRAYVRHEIGDEQVEVLVDGALSPADEVLRNEALTQLEEVLDTLPLEQRAVLTLFELDGLSCQAIADLVEAPLGTVYSRLRLAREGFRRAAARVEARAMALSRRSERPAEGERRE